ncbi:esterase/lipase family protein [Actinomadura rubteroloni]|nr:alpha/beta fold hydrolase [Actinomadura rubteroloni]
MTEHRTRRPMPCLLVVLPGIGGSALRTADGTVVWGLAAARNPVRVPGLLVPKGADLADPGYRDGIEPYDLLAAPIPALTRLAGAYTRLRARLDASYELDPTSNYLEFPYDWRRPAAYNAELLGDAIEARRHGDTKVVIVAHSMGGLIARHYLQNDDRAVHCARVITLGTPHRGAVKALGYLVNGVEIKHLPFAVLAETLRRVPSLYELLPLYPVVADRRAGVRPRLRRAGNLAAALGLDADLVEHGAAFLRDLNVEHEFARRLDAVAGFGARTTPQQATLHSLHARRVLRVSGGTDLLAAHEDGGDGTVPVVSARPGGAAGVSVGYSDQTHQGVVSAPSALRTLVLMIDAVLNDLEHDPFLGAADRPGGDPGAPELALLVDVDDYYPSGEPVVIGGTARAWGGGRKLWARLGTNAARPVALAEDGTFTADLGAPAPGVHPLALADDADGPALLRDVVEVV